MFFLSTGAINKIVNYELHRNCVIAVILHNWWRERHLNYKCYIHYQKSSLTHSFKNDDFTLILLNNIF